MFLQSGSRAKDMDRKQKKAPQSGAVVCLDRGCDPGVELIHRIRSFTPGEKADDNDHSKNSHRDQVALNIHIVKHGVDFFHNLNFSFQKWF